MKLNNPKHLSYFSREKSGVDKEGWLFKKGEVNTSYQKRWCVLKGNLLFYYEKKNDPYPVGTIILEKCSVQLAEGGDSPYTFSIHFEGDSTRVYKLTADDEKTCMSWMKALTTSSYRYMQFLVDDLEKEVEELKQNSLKRTQYYDHNKHVGILNSMHSHLNVDNQHKGNLWLAGSGSTLKELASITDMGKSAKESMSHLAATTAKSSKSLIKRMSPKPIRKLYNNQRAGGGKTTAAFFDRKDFVQLHEQYRTELYEAAGAEKGAIPLPRKSSLQKKLLPSKS